MLYDDEDVMPRYLLSETTLIPHRGRMADDMPRMERSCFTKDELEAIAPNMSEAEWALVSHNKHSKLAQRIIQQRIKAAHELKVKHVRSLR